MVQRLVDVVNYQTQTRRHVHYDFPDDRSECEDYVAL
jgi:hypothetical protein